MKKLPSMASISNLEMAGERVRNYFDHLVSTKRLVRSWKTETFVCYCRNTAQNSRVTMLLCKAVMQELQILL